MGLWTWKAFVRKNGRNVVKEWVDEHSDAAFAAFTVLYHYLDNQLPSGWDRPFVGTLAGGKRKRKTGCAGLRELIFDQGNVQYRPLGYHSGEMEFTILYMAEERGNDFYPPNSCETAKERRVKIETEERNAREFSI